jgi:hypothetical protein
MRQARDADESWIGERPGFIYGSPESCSTVMAIGAGNCPSRENNGCVRFTTTDIPSRVDEIRKSNV